LAIVIVLSIYWFNELFPVLRDEVARTPFGEGITRNLGDISSSTLYRIEMGAIRIGRSPEFRQAPILSDLLRLAVSGAG